jgi:phage shock protein C
MKKLTRSSRDRVIAGVCGGLGEYFGIDPVLFRILFVVATLAGGSGVLIYFVLSLAIPDANAPASQTWEQSIERNAEQFAKSVENMGGDFGAKAKPYAGFAMVAVGTWLLFANLGLTLFNFAMLFPAILIAIGVIVIIKGIRQ